MLKSDTQRIQELQDQVHALQQLLLAHILAFDQVDRLATDATLQIALGQSDAALDQGRTNVTVRIDAMIQHLKYARD